MSIIRELSAAAITDAVERLCIEANTQPARRCEGRAGQGRGRRTVAAGERNAGPFAENLWHSEETCPSARTPAWPACSVELGHDVHIDGDLTTAVNEGVRRGYDESLPAQVHHR